MATRRVKRVAAIVAIDTVQQGSTVITDGWQPYRPATADLYNHERLVSPGVKASDLTPGVHRIASLAQRWLLGTHQGAVDESHLTSTSTSSSSGSTARSRSPAMVFYRVLELAAAHDPVRYRDLILTPRPQQHPTDRARDARTTTEP